MATNLKTQLACGGSYKEDHVELQGNHEFRIIPILEKMGFDADSIDISKK